MPEIARQSPEVALHRYRTATAMSHLNMRVEEFPFPIPTLGMDMIWNPWLADDQFKSWLRGIFVEAAASL